jgi:hypothetical protein
MSALFIVERFRVGGEAYLQAEERADDPEADDDS